MNPSTIDKPRRKDPRSKESARQTLFLLKLYEQSLRCDRDRVAKELAEIDQYRHWEILGYPSKEAFLEAELTDREFLAAMSVNGGEMQQPAGTMNSSIDTSAEAPPARATTWRDVFRVHPCADVFPMLSDAELDALAADIKENGLRQPVLMWCKKDRWYVLDGRNRLEALERAGFVIPRIGADLSANNYIEHPKGFLTVFEGVGDRDPAAVVISANIRRRHLSKKQQAELIVRTIEAAKPIDRATVARSFNTTPGQKGGSTKDPVLSAAVAEGEKHGISKRTIQTARAKVNGKIPAPRKTIDVSSSTTTTTVARLLNASQTNPAVLHLRALGRACRSVERANRQLEGIDTSGLAGASASPDEFVRGAVSCLIAELHAVADLVADIQKSLT